MYLISTPAKTVLGGFEIHTLEDAVYGLMKDIALGEAGKEEKKALFEGALLEYSRG